MPKIPDKFIPLIQAKKNITVAMAKGYSSKNESTRDITNAMNLFLYFYWDSESCDNKGGIQLYKLKQIFNGMNLNNIWISYLINTPNINISDPPKSIIPHLKFMLIDLYNTKVYKYNAYNIPGIFGIEPLEVMFDQISFNPEFSW